jgi:lipoprotein-releasing system permease protein
MNELTLFLSRSSLRPRPGQRLRFDYIVMILGIVLSVAVVCTALNLFEGYQRALKKILLETNSHIMIYPNRPEAMSPGQAEEVRGKISRQSEVKSVHLVYANTAMAQGSGKVCSVFLRAYAPASPDSYWYASYLTGKRNSKLASGSILIGNKLAQDLGVKAGDRLTLLYPRTDNFSPFGLIPLQSKFTVQDIVRTGYYEMDKSLLIMNNTDAYHFFQIEPQYSYIEVNLIDNWVDKVVDVNNDMQKMLGNDFLLRSWVDFNGNLFSLITMEKWLIFLVLSFLILIAALNCLSTVSTSIIDRQKELAILQTLGVTLKQVKQVVYLRIMFICTASICVGLAIGAGLAWLITQQSLYSLKGDVYFIDRITTHVSPLNYLSVFTLSVLLVYVCIRLPLKAINRIEIIDVLRGTA